MLDLENYHPPTPAHKCRECAYYIREGNGHSRSVILRCQKQPFYVKGRRSYHKTKANNPACPAFHPAITEPPKQ